MHGLCCVKFCCIPVFSSRGRLSPKVTTPVWRIEQADPNKQSMEQRVCLCGKVFVSESERKVSFLVY